MEDCKTSKHMRPLGKFSERAVRWQKPDWMLKLHAKQGQRAISASVMAEVTRIEVFPFSQDQVDLIHSDDRGNKGLEAQTDFYILH